MSRSVAMRMANKTRIMKKLNLKKSRRKLERGQRMFDTQKKISNRKIKKTLSMERKVRGKMDREVMNRMGRSKKKRR